MSPPSALSLFAALAVLMIAVAAALGTAVIEWLLWRSARRLGLPLAPSGGVGGWIAGLAGLPSGETRRGEPIGVGVGYAMIAGASVLAAALVAEAALGDDPPGSLGVLAFVPVLFAVGYAVAAERARTAEAGRHRMALSGRILFATPSWAAAVAAWAVASGSLDVSEAAASPLAAWARAALAFAIVATGLFVLPGNAGETGLTARPWGGDTHEASRAVRTITAVTHYGVLATIGVLAGSAFGGHLGFAGWVAGTAAAGIVAFLLRVAATLPGVGAAVKLVPRFGAPIVLVALWLAGGGRAG